MESRISSVEPWHTLPQGPIDAIIQQALREDVEHGDVTTLAVVPPHQQGQAATLVKQAGMLAGNAVAARVFTLLDNQVRIEELVPDGTPIKPGDTTLRVAGPLRAILTGERVALNLLQHLSGIATLTRRFVEAVQGTPARIIDTRKTTPGLRILEKYAVRVGGGANHRYGLADGILIKDNHIAACGSITEAVRRAREHTHHLLRIQVEVKTLGQVQEALAAGADSLLLDNMSVDQMREAVRLVGGRALTEASGGITLATVTEIAGTGVDLISIGALTHSAPALDISLKIKG